MTPDVSPRATTADEPASRPADAKGRRHDRAMSPPLDDQEPPPGAMHVVRHQMESAMSEQPPPDAVDETSFAYPPVADVVTEPYYDADGITLYLGDCRDVTWWLDADVLVTDPPYGIGWKRGVKPGRGDAGHDGIAGDADTTCRDEALTLWGADRPALVFGSFWAPAPANVRQTLVYRKPPDSGVIGSTTGWRRDVEPVYVVGAWPKRDAHRSSLFTTTVAGAGNLAGRYGHPHTKPGDVLAELIRDCPPGTIADPFAGSGSTLLAARAQGRRAVGVELKEPYCEVIASRLAQGDLFGETA